MSDKNNKNKKNKNNDQYLKQLEKLQSKEGKNKRLVFIICVLIICITLLILTLNTPNSIDPETYKPNVYSTVFSLLPPLAAIILALITKEVYSSLFFGIVVGALLYANGNAEVMMNTAFFNQDGGMIYKLADSWNIGILVFLVVLGIMVSLMNKVGGSAAFGIWASEHIKTRIGTQIATVALGVLIFVDDYFNCLTVGSVMRPVTDRQNVSRAKLAYIIDATAAPVCIIAPVSSWAAAVTSSVPADSGINGFAMFLKTIPYNFYAILTPIMIFILIVKKFEFGPMKEHEKNALEKGDLFTTSDRPYGNADQEMVTPYGKVIDLVFPVVVLIIFCILGMIYTGGFFSGESFVSAFANSDASKGLVFGSFISLVITFCFYIGRGVLTFNEFTKCIPEGFRAMVAPILILTMAWTLSGMTGLLGAKDFVGDMVASSASELQMFLPVCIFLVAVFLAFSTGTSWGTFAILIPIVCNVFLSSETYEMLVISISACLSGSVCGDHCSPISDTTIMASAGAHCSHVNHVATQLPYAITVAAVSAVGFLIAGIIGYQTESTLSIISLPITIMILVITLFVIKKVTSEKETKNTSEKETKKS